MQAQITQKLLPRLKPETEIDGVRLTAPYEIRDALLKGFVIRVQPSGIRSYIAQYGRGKRVTLGSVDVMLLSTARERARQIINAAKDGSKKTEIQAIAKPATSPDRLTLETYLTDIYSAWLASHNKRGAEEAHRLAINFREFLDRPLADINKWVIEKWRTERLKAGRAPATINRVIAPLLAAIHRAREWGHIDSNPLEGLKPLKQPRIDAEKVRYLTAAEETALRQALADRDQRKRAGRESGNEWRQERGRDLLPDIGHYADALTPLVLLSINTGCRRGELFSLRWLDVHDDRRLITIRAATAKGAKTRHIPLNDEAVAVLKTWRAQSSGDGLVFPGREGERLTDVKKAWKALLAGAGISGFRWHDMRHHFASRLVMNGIDLNTVRELLGHADIKMTLRYAHLAPQHLAAAVASLSAPVVAAVAKGKRA